MGYKLRVSEDASQELDEILEYIAGKLKNREAALAFLDELEEKYRLVCENPEMYEKVRDVRLAMKGYRKILVKNSVVLYRTEDEKKEIQVNGIFYCGRDYGKYL